MRFTFEVDGHLAFLLNAFLGAYERRTDAMVKISQQEADLASLKHQLESGADPLKAAVDNQSKEK